MPTAEAVRRGESKQKGCTLSDSKRVLFQKIEFCVGAARLLFTFANRNVYVFDKLLDSHVTCQKKFSLCANLKVHEHNLKMLLSVASNPMDCLCI